MTTVCASVGLVAALLVHAVPAHAQAVPTIEPVLDGLHVIRGVGGNIAVRATGVGVVLVDTGPPGRFREVEELMASVTSEQVRHVVNTHMHPDHTGGNAQLPSGLSVVAHTSTRDLMLRNDQTGPPGMVFTEGAALHVGEVEVRLVHLGAGHTAGDVVVYFPDLRAVHVGDLLHEVAPFIDYEHGGASSRWVATLNALLELDFDTVIPGHGSVMGRSDVIAFRNQMETIRWRIREMIRGGALRRHVGPGIVSRDLSWTLARSGGFMSRSLAGLYDELAAEVRR